MLGSLKSINLKSPEIRLLFIDALIFLAVIHRIRLCYYMNRK